MPNSRNFSFNEFDDFDEDDLNIVFDILEKIERVSPDKEGFLSLPIFDLSDKVLLPNSKEPIFSDSKINKNLLKSDQINDGIAIGISLKNKDINNNFKKEDFNSIGVQIALVPFVMDFENEQEKKQMYFLSANSRINLIDIEYIDNLLYAKVKIISEPKEDEYLLQTYFKALESQFEEYLSLTDDFDSDLFYQLENFPNFSSKADWIASQLNINNNEKNLILEEISVVNRIQLVLDFYIRENNRLKLKEELNEKINSRFEKNQKEAFLREQLNEIQTELGHEDPWKMEINQLQKLIRKTRMPIEVQKVAQKELHRLTMMAPMSPESAIIRTYLEWLTDLPWYKKSIEVLDVKKAKEILDSNHYGMEKAKDRILEFIAVKSLKPKNEKQPILCFVGPPGTGKTSMGKSIANALNREFVRISLGGVKDESEIRGHRRTYIGAMPGRIIQTIKKAGKTNPVFMLDEIDKLASDHRGDPSSALLEVLDPEQNNSFSDNYLEVPYDLSDSMFITTANSQDTIPWPLLDRMEIIEFNGYIEEDKIEICKKFIVKRQLEINGLDNNEIEFSIEALQSIIRKYTYEAGVRNLERMIGNVCRKIARKKAEKIEFEHVIEDTMLLELLGPPLFNETKILEIDSVGVATALAWTYNGGEIMPVEVLITSGKGQLHMTGSLGEVMQESIQAGLTYLKANSEILEIEDIDFEEIDVHIHVPEGAVPKDGPSAGVTILTAMLSAFTDKKIRRDVGMTGEITLLGRVLPIGGVKEKVLAAHRAGIKTIILPELNKKDIVEIPEKILNKIDIKFVKSFLEVVEIALIK